MGVLKVKTHPYLIAADLEWYRGVKDPQYRSFGTRARELQVNLSNH